MAGIVDICNIALIAVGAKTIGSIDDQGKEAELCKTRYGSVRDLILSGYSWNASTKRATLAPLTEGPVWGDASRFALPSDCLRVLRLDDIDLFWTVEGRELVCEADQVNILYTAAVDDPTLFPPHLVEAIAAQLAYEVAYALKANKTMLEILAKAAAEKLTDARSFDAMEGTPEIDTGSDWLDARL